MSKYKTTKRVVKKPPVSAIRKMAAGGYKSKNRTGK